MLMISMLIIKCRKASCSGDRFYNTYMHVKTEMFGALICMNVHQNSMTSDIHPYKNSKLNPPMQPPEVWWLCFTSIPSGLPAMQVQKENVSK
jgi:hypothetical protein